MPFSNRKNRKSKIVNCNFSPPFPQRGRKYKTSQIAVQGWLKSFFIKNT